MTKPTGDGNEVVTRRDKYTIEQLQARADAFEEIAESLEHQYSYKDAFGVQKKIIECYRQIVEKLQTAQKVKKVDVFYGETALDTIDKFEASVREKTKKKHKKRKIKLLISELAYGEEIMTKGKVKLRKMSSGKQGARQWEISYNDTWYDIQSLAKELRVPRWEVYYYLIERQVTWQKFLAKIKPATKLPIF